MNLSPIVFLIEAFGILITAFIIEGGQPSHLMSLTAFLIVVGGTTGATGLSYPLKDFKRMPGAVKKAFTAKENNLSDLIIFFRNLSTKARKNGLLSIESEINVEGIDPFIQKGLQLVVDGVDPQTIQGILELEADATVERHKKAIAMFESAGGYCPTMGIVGTVMGMVHILGNLGGDSSKIGELIAPAFLATLYGIAFANIIFLPIGNRLKLLNEYENAERELIIEAVLLIQTGTNPNTLAEKLKGFLNKNDRVKLDTSEKEVS